MWVRQTQRATDYRQVRAIGGVGLNVVLIWGMNSVAILIQIQDVKKKEILMKLPLLQIWDCIFNSIPIQTRVCHMVVLDSTT